MFFSSERAVSRLSSSALLLMATSGALLFTSCDDLLPKRGAKWVPPEQREAQSPEGQFREARLELMDGKAAAAAARLRKLDARKDIPQPLHNWITLYAGLAELEAGREEEARTVFAKLAERGPFTKDDGPASQRLAEFFVELGEKLSAPGPVPERLASNYDRMNHEAIALYLYALKNENAGDFPEALAFHRQFSTTDLKEKEPWQGYEIHFMYSRRSSLNLLEYEDYIVSTKRALEEGSERTPEQVKRAVDEANKLRERLKRGGKLLASLDKTLDKYRTEVNEKAEMYAADQAADAKALPEAKKKWEKLLSEYLFVDAKQAILEPKFTTEKAREEQEMLAAKTTNLENFKFYLIQELRAVGYTQPITLKDGTVFPGGIESLEETTITLRDKEGTKVVPWKDVTAESIYEMAKSLVTTEEPEDAQGFRKWHLGSFAGFIGKTSEARELLTEAVKLNPSYEPELQMALGWLDETNKNN